jgi:hypothetical protein
MGYYTTYHLDIQGKGIDFDKYEIFEEIGIISRYGEEMFEDGSAYEIKWYSHEEDMTQISKKYPDLLFILNGNGEENGDIWRKHFKNGKTHFSKAKIVFDDFDPEKF